MTADPAWDDVVMATSLRLASLSGADLAAFQPLLDVIASVGPSRDGSLAMEWVAPSASPRFGVTVFEHGMGEGHLIVARSLCEEHFGAEAREAWGRTLSEVSPFAIGRHVGLAWDPAHGYRLKLFLGGGVDIAGVARCLGLEPHANLIGVGCDFWAGGRYRERRYFQAGSVDALRALAPEWDAEFVPPFTPVGRQHVILTRTQDDDALGVKATWSLIFPPQATLLEVETSFPGAVHPMLQSLAQAAVPFVLRPSAYEIDRYRDGREERELLVTLGPPGAVPL